MRIKLDHKLIHLIDKFLNFIRELIEIIDSLLIN